MRSHICLADELPMYEEENKSNENNESIYVAEKLASGHGESRAC